jgi:predicted RNA-binding Zn-ribbon protein involved in translation (DUF1610 family)
MSDDPTDSGQSMAERWRRSQMETARGKAEEANSPSRPDENAAPVRCPSCRSNDILTTGKAAAADNYWRCLACGEVWNAGRSRSSARGGFRR